MADKKPESASAPAEQAKPEKKGGIPIKTVAIVAALMVLEAAVVVLVFGVFGGPKQSHAETQARQLEHDDSGESQEVQIADEKFQNLSTGRVWVWDIAVFVQVKNKNAERVQQTLEQRKAEIQEGLSQIISRAQLAHLKEPERQSISRQFSAFLEKTIGSDAEGKPLFDRVIIPKCRGFPADF